jgi:phage gp36-like protein
MYITKQQVLDLYPDVKRTYNEGKITDAQIEEYITRAESIINLYLSRRYTIPLSVRCPIIETIAFELFEHFYNKDRLTPSYGGEADSNTWLDTRYRRQIALLELIASGEYALFDENNKVIAPNPAKKVMLDSVSLTDKSIFNFQKEPIDQEIPDGYAGDKRE